MDEIQKRIILCAGHGGGDPGATGQGTTEASEVIDIVNRTVDYLRSDGQLEVVQVPNELSFEDGIAWVNARYGDIDSAVAIEVHKNAGVGGHGVEVWYVQDDISRTIAQRLEDKLGNVLPARGIKDDTTNRWGRLGWCRDVNTWAPLVEMGFITDGGDPVGAAANDGYAKSLAEGCLNIYGLGFKPVPVPPVQPPVVNWLYKVVSTADGKQLGVYNVKANAWAKYQFVQGAAKIVDPAGNDLTPAFSLEFNPPRPVEQPYNPKEDIQANTALLNKILELLQGLIAKITSIFK